MAGRPCTVCADTTKARRAAEMIAAGASDLAIARAIGCSRMAVSRHRHSHVEAPARALAAVASKGMDVREQRKKTVAAAQRGELDPATFLSVGALTNELRKAADRLERASTEAEQNGQLGALAQLIGQAHRNVETRAKLAGHGGFAAAKTAVGINLGGAPAFEPFVLRMRLSDRTETLVMGTENVPDFEVRDATTGRPFEREGPTIVTPAGEAPPDLLIVPRGYPTDAPAIDGAIIEHIAREVADEDEIPDDPEDV